MFLWNVWYADDEWCCFVIAPTRNRVKALFQDYWRGGEFTNIRCRKVKPTRGQDEGVYDTPCPMLEELGIRYPTEEEMDKLEALAW